MESDPDSSLSDVPPEEPELSRGSSVSSEFQNECEDFVTMAVNALSQSRISDQPSLKSPGNGDERIVGEVEIDVDNEAKETEDQMHLNNSNFLEVKTAISQNKAKDTAEVKRSPTAPKSVHKKPPNQPTDKGRVDKFEQGLLLLEPSGNDEEMVRLENIVDGWSFDLKRNILAEYNQSKYRLKGFVKKMVDEEKAKVHSTIQELRDQVVALQDLCKSYQETVQRRDQVVASLSQEVAKQKEKVELANKFANWRQAKEEKKREDFCSALAVRFHRQRLQKFAFTTWKVAVEGTWKEQFDKRCQYRAQEVCRKLADEYEDKMDALHRELEVSRQEVVQTRAAHTQLEEQMRKALMRGVCALNMEAMTVLGPSHPQETGSSLHQETSSSHHQEQHELHSPANGTRENGFGSSREMGDYYTQSKQTHFSEDRQNRTSTPVPNDDPMSSNRGYARDLDEIPRASLSSPHSSLPAPPRPHSASDRMHSSMMAQPYQMEASIGSHRTADSTRYAEQYDPPRLHNHPPGSPSTPVSMVIRSEPRAYLPAPVTEGPGHTVTASLDARRHLTSRVSGKSSIINGPPHVNGGVLTVRADNPSGSALHSSGVAGVLVERHQPVNKRTLGPMIEQHRVESSLLQRSMPESRLSPVNKRLAGQLMYSTSKY